MSGYGSHSQQLFLCLVVCLLACLVICLEICVVVLNYFCIFGCIIDFVKADRQVVVLNNLAGRCS